MACKDEYVGNDHAPYSRAQPDTQYAFYGSDAEPDGISQGGVSYTPGQTWMKDKEIVSGTYPGIAATYVYMP